MFGIGLSGFETLARLGDSGAGPTLLETKEVPMRSKFTGWKHLLYTAAALATLALAAGARYKPN
jgi:hypothetical protein